MNNRRTALVVLIALAITPMATAQVYKCDGPNGPVYSDKECEPGAAEVALENTSGVSGVSDQAKAELADKKSARELDDGRNTNTTLNNYQYQAPDTEVNERQVLDRDRPKNLDAAARPVQPKEKPSPKKSTRRKQ